MDSSYGALSKSDEKLRAEKNYTGDPPAAGLLYEAPCHLFCRNNAPTIFAEEHPQQSFLPPASAVEVIESEPCVGVRV